MRFRLIIEPGDKIRGSARSYGGIAHELVASVGERAVATGTREAGRGLRTELRRQVTGAGLRQRLANSWREKHYPNQRLDPASLVYNKAPQIIRAFDEGAVIRSRRGCFLAIPTENAPRKGTDGKRISPTTFPEHRFGLLRFVPRPAGPPVEGESSAAVVATSRRAVPRPAMLPSMSFCSRSVLRSKPTRLSAASA